MKLYIYNQGTNEIAVIINGTSNNECEDKASKNEIYNSDQDLYAWTYSNNELIYSEETIEI